MVPPRSWIFLLLCCSVTQISPLEAGGPTTERLNSAPVGFAMMHDELLLRGPQGTGEESLPSRRRAMPAGRTGSGMSLNLRWLHATNRGIDAEKEALTVSSLSTDPLAVQKSAARFRVEISGVRRPSSVRVSLVSIDPDDDRVRDRLDISDMEVTDQGRVLSPWLVLVADRDDRSAPGLAQHCLLVALGDRVEARVRIGGRRASVWSIPVGRRDGIDAIEELETRFVVLANPKTGRPVAGGDEAGVEALVRHQLHVAKQVFAQCGVTVSEPSLARFEMLEPPTSSLIAVGDRLGLLSRGGLVRFQVNGRKLGPWKIGARYTPLQTARLISHHLESEGFYTELSENPRQRAYAHGSADIVVKAGNGTPATIEPWDDAPLSTEPMQSIEIGRVDIEDGIDAYDDRNAAVGTLEERTLVKSLRGGNRKTIEIFVIGGFSTPDRQGESFIWGNGSSLRNTIILDLQALARARQAYTLSHELGHILLDDLGHPDGRGEPDTSSLMHSRSSSAVGGPKRISRSECKQIRKNINRLLK